MTEKTKEQLQADAEKAAKDLQAVTEKLQSAQKELEAKPDDEKLKKKVEGLAKGAETAKQKAEAALKEAGKPSTPDAGKKTESKKIRLKVHSKTGYPAYFRAGLKFTAAESECEVTEDVAGILKKDPWLSVEEIK